MPDERQRVRELEEAKRRQRPQPPPTQNRASNSLGTEPGAATGLSRRSLVGWIAGGAAIAAAGTYALLPRRRSFDLPIPSGQIVGPEYRAATLAVKPAPTLTMPTDGHGWSSCVASQASESIPGLDLVLAVDTTGSMGGVLYDIKSNLQQLISNLRAKGSDIRVGVIGYKDLCDAEMIRPFPLTPLDGQGAGLLSSFISGLQPGGGCDWPEKMDAALGAAASMAWRGNVPASIVVIADAPAHPQDESAANAIAQAFRTKVPGAQLSLIDTGSGGHPFMRALPKSGGGQYVTYDGRILNSLFPAVTGCAST